MDFSTADRLLADAIDQSVTPAAVIEAGCGDAPIWRERFGRLTYGDDAPATRLDTIFDLASLTKVMATTSLAMKAIAEERLALDAPVGAYVEAWRGADRRAVSIRHLLEHSSGLPGHVRLWETVRGRAAYERAICAAPLNTAPGAAPVYSDLGFMLLGFALESARGRPLDEQFVELREAWNGTSSFNPARALEPRIAPTEYDAEHAGFLRGVVHDENARALGGVAGHAGLFGTAEDVGAFARLVLRTFRETTALGSPPLMRTFAAESHVPASTRALGWDTMRPTSSCGTLMSPGSIGHTGFTGTSLWIDHVRDLYVVLLTNRVHPTRANESHLALRPRVHDAIVAAFDAGLRDAGVPG